MCITNQYLFLITINWSCIAIGFRHGDGGMIDDCYWIRYRYWLTENIPILFLTLQQKIKTKLYVEQQHMSDKLPEEHCVYYDGQVDEKRLRKIKKSFKKNGDNLPPPHKFHRDRVSGLNQEYFPTGQTGRDDSSLDSKSTQKIKIISRSSMPRLRPNLQKPNPNPSPSLSQKSTKKHLHLQLTNLSSALHQKNHAPIHSPHRIKEVEVMELYRVISFYEGKVRYLEEQIRRYEDVLERIGRECDEKSRHKAEVGEMVRIFQDFRRENTELSAKLEQKDYTIGSLQQKSHKLQIKLNFLTSKQTYLKASTSKINSSQASNSSPSPSPSKPSNSLNSLNCSKNHISSAMSALSLKQKQQNYGNIQSKINKIEISLNFLKKENQILTAEIQEKEQKIFGMEKELLMYRHQMDKNDTTTCKANQSEPLTGETRMKLNPAQMIDSRYKKQDPLNQTTVLPTQSNKIPPPPRSILQPNPSPSSPSSPSQPSQPQSLISNHSNNSSTSRATLQSLIQKTKETLHAQTFQKLKYQLLTQEVSYQKLINFLAMEEELQPEVLEEFPYNLQTEQAEHLVQWIKELSEVCAAKEYSLEDLLKAVIPTYSNITLKKQRALKTQIANQFLNREKEFDDAMKGKEKIDFSQMEEHLKEWGLNQQHLDTIGKTYYEETGEVQLAHMGIIRSIFEKWCKKQAQAR